MIINNEILQELLELDDETFVVEAYRSILGREADENGLKEQLGNLKNGISKKDFLVNLVLSPEAKEKNVSVQGWQLGIIDIAWLIDCKQEDFVNKAYIMVLGRNADGNGWLHYQRQLLSKLQSRAEIIDGISNSDEGRLVGTKVDGLEESYKRKKIRRQILQIPILGKIIKGILIIMNYNKIAKLDKQISQDKIDNLQNKVSQLENRLLDLQQQIEHTKSYIKEAYIDEMSPEVLAIYNQLNGD